jgi:hypothetical protein
LQNCRIAELQKVKAGRLECRKSQGKIDGRKKVRR